MGLFPTFLSLGRGSWLHRSPFTPPIAKLVSAQTLYEDVGPFRALEKSHGRGGDACLSARSEENTKNEGEEEGGGD